MRRWSLKTAGVRSWLILAAGFALAACLPLVGGNYALRLGTVLGMYTVLALCWSFIGGLAGYPSFATAAFFGLGAYAAAILQGAGTPMWASWVAAGLITAAFAGVLGIAILHLKGHYFAIASLAITEVLRELVNTHEGLTGGGMGLNLPMMRLGIAAQSQFFYYAMGAVAALTAAVAVLVHHGKLGFGLRCIQQNEDAAGLLGLNARLYKTGAFVLSALFVGMAGGVYANYVRYIEPSDVFDILFAVKPLVMVLLGGLGTLFGPILGAAMFLALEELVWRTFLNVHSAVLGLLIVALVLFLPRGIAGLRLMWPIKFAKPVWFKRRTARPA